MNISHLTEDTLNYKMDWAQTTPSDQIYDSWDPYKGDYADDIVNILDVCVVDYMVESVIYSCTVNGNAVVDITSLNGGDEVFCSLDVKNNLNASIISDRLGWSISIIAKEASNYYFPHQSVTHVDVENGMINTAFTVPQCKGDWDISLIVNQEPVGGKKIILWNVKNVENGGQCVALNRDRLLGYIDEGSLNDKFVTFTGFDALDDIEPSASSEKGDSTVTIVVVCLVLFFLIVIGLIGFWVWKRKKNAEERSYSVRKSIDLFHVQKPVATADLFSNGQNNAYATSEMETTNDHDTLSSPLSATKQSEHIEEDIGTKEATPAVDEPTEDDQVGEERECGQCGLVKAGKVDENDGEFYCFGCWESYE